MRAGKTRLNSHSIGQLTMLVPTLEEIDRKPLISVVYPITTPTQQPIKIHLQSPRQFRWTLLRHHQSTQTIDLECQTPSTSNKTTVDSTQLYTHNSQCPIAKRWSLSGTQKHRRTYNMSFKACLIGPLRVSSPRRMVPPIELSRLPP